MKIGHFAKNHNVSVDTIRYYMELELIIPEKPNGQYEFYENCNSDIKEILWLKAANFSLNEIQRIFTLKRLTNLKNDEDMQYYKALFRRKRDDLINRRTEIDEIINRIDIKLSESKIEAALSATKIGVPIDLLHIISCPRCNEKLKLHRASVEENIIINGELKCSCGFEAHIKEGIIILKTDYKRIYLPKDSLEGHFVEQTSNEFVSILYKCGQWIMKRMHLKDLNDKVILELGTGSGIFLNNIIRELPEDSIYICVDHDLEILRNTRERVEKYENKGNFIFICCDFAYMPIKNGIIDLVIDYYGTSNYNFTKEGYLINMLHNKVKDTGQWVGGYFNFKHNAKSLLQLPKENRKYLYIENIIKSFQNSKFKTVEMKDMGYTEKGGIYEPFFIEGDKLYDFVYHGEKVE